MKAFKGCVNTSCAAYKKIHYKRTDEFCTKCGEPLQYVCADCWTQLDDGAEKYCILCKNRRKDETERRVEKVKNTSKAVAAFTATVTGAVVMVVKNTKQLKEAAKDIVKIGKDVIKK